MLRLVVDHEEALAEVPPAPQGGDVSVSFSSARAAATAAAALEALGYRTVGVVHGDAAEEPVADFLVSPDVIEQHPGWWRSLVAGADHVFNLAAGPVQVALAAVVRTHREPLR